MALVAILLAGCSALVPAPTATPLGTPTPSASPTPTLTPTATPDPSMPEGATGKNSEGVWVKGEYLWLDEIHQWVRPFNVEPIPLYDRTKESNNLGHPDNMWQYIDVAENAPGSETLGLLTHRLDTQDPEGNDFNGSLLGRLDRRLQKTTFEIDEGKVTCNFVTSEGPQVWRLGPNTRILTHIISPDDANGDGFREWSDPNGTHFIARFLTDEEGNLIQFIASRVPLDELSDKQIYAMILFAPVSALRREDQTDPGYSTDLDILATRAESDPFFEITPRQ